MPRKGRAAHPNVIYVEKLPCVVNGWSCIGDVVAHHITTRGAGGDDERDNLAPLCVLHHKEIHDIGRFTFCNRYSRFKDYLVTIGRDDILKKLEASGYR